MIRNFLYFQNHSSEALVHWSIELGETRMRFSSVAKKGYTPTLSSPIGSGLTLEGGIAGIDVYCNKKWGWEQYPRRCAHAEFL